VFDSAGRCLPTKHNIYVDDDLLAKVRTYMPQALALGFEGIFTIMGHSCPLLCPVAVALDKLEELEVSLLQILLGLRVNTQEMTVTISDKFYSKVLALLTTTWHCRQESFMIKELELLVTNLDVSPKPIAPFTSLCHISTRP
jgi:hypothetical protein